MYTAARRYQLNPATARRGVAISIEAAERVTSLTGLRIVPFTTAMSGELGTIFHVAWADDLAHFEQADAKLAGDDSFNEWVEGNADLFVGTAQNMLMKTVYGGPAAHGPPAYVMATQALCTPGSVADAMAAGVELAQAAERLTGRPAIFSVAVTGRYGGVPWSGGAPDIETLQAASEAMANDPEFASLVARHSSSFQPNGTTTILRRLD
jgi:hypothetical protein